MPVIFIEFAGLCIGVNEPTRTRLLLPHTRSVGGPEHTPVLLIRDHVGLVGTPHFTVTLGKRLEEYAGWYIGGRVRLFGLNQKYELPDQSEPTETKYPTWRSVKYLANLGEIADARELQDLELLPLAAEMSLEHGVLIPVGFNDVLRYNYEYEEKDRKGDKIKKTKKNVYQAPRLRADRAALRIPKVTAPFKISFTGPQGIPEIVTVNHTVKSRIVVSNLTAASAQAVSHMDTYYECVKGTRRPKVVQYLPVKPKGYRKKGPEEKDDYPYNPDECIFMWFQPT